MDQTGRQLSLVILINYIITNRFIKGQGIYSFGYGANGRLGIGNDSNQLTPVLIEGLKGLNIKQISCGHHHTVVLTGIRMFSASH